MKLRGEHIYEHRRLQLQRDVGQLEFDVAEVVAIEHFGANYLATAIAAARIRLMVITSSVPGQVHFLEAEAPSAVGQRLRPFLDAELRDSLEELAHKKRHLGARQM